MVTIDSVTTELIKKWVDQEQLFKKTIDNFWEYLSNYKNEQPDEYKQVFKDGDDTQISLSEQSLALVIYPDYYGNENFTYCTIRFVIEYKGQCVGAYRAMYDIDDGECFDDVLTF